MVFWPTLPGRCPTSHGFLAHPAGDVHHLPWFSGPPCRAGAPLAVVFCRAGAPLAMVCTGAPLAMVFFLLGPPCQLVLYLLWFLLG